MEARLLAPVWMMEAFHHTQHWSPAAWIVEHRIPPSFLALEPLPHTAPIDCTSVSRDGLGQVTELLSQ